MITKEDIKKNYREAHQLDKNMEYSMFISSRYTAYLVSVGFNIQQVMGAVFGPLPIL